jgi:hypothetical protein
MATARMVSEVMGGSSEVEDSLMVSVVESVMKERAQRECYLSGHTQKITQCQHPSKARKKEENLAT